MATTTVTASSQTTSFKNFKDTVRSSDHKAFPGSARTSGQHPPLYEQLYPYSAFPKHIESSTTWRGENYVSHLEKWVHPFSEAEIAEISRAADSFIASDLPLTDITRDDFPIPILQATLNSTKNELLNGKGFALYKGLPVREWGNHKAAVAYMGFSAYLGHFVSQNGRGHVLGHVKDLGEDSTAIDKVRIYRTNARQYFHSDDCDVVGLLCLARAEFGGESDVASMHYVWNILQEERPDIAELLTKPIWYFDRKGEVSRGQDPYIRTAVYYLETPDPTDPNRQQRLYCKWDPYYVRSLKRFSDVGIIPPFSKEQEEATQVLEDVCNRVKLHMVLQTGDMQFVSNSHTLHARTAYRDYSPDSDMPRRHLMRLWLSVPQDEGGWRLPFRDANEKKRGGVQFNDTPPVARLDAD